MSAYHIVFVRKADYIFQQVSAAPLCHEHSIQSYQLGPYAIADMANIRIFPASRFATEEGSAKCAMKILCTGPAEANLAHSQK